MLNKINSKEDQGESAVKMTRIQIRQQLDCLAIQFNVTIITSALELENFHTLEKVEQAGYVSLSSLNGRWVTRIDAQISAIIKLAKEDGVPIPVIFADIEKWGHRKKDRPGITACLVAAKQRGLATLYLASFTRILWGPKGYSGILNELISNGLRIRALYIPFDSSTDDGKVIVSLLNEFGESSEYFFRSKKKHLRPG